MADKETSTAPSKVDFCSELLSPSELFGARTRSNKIPVRGQKEFSRSDSEKQKERLQQSLEEHWALIAEERVERLGSLVKGLWIPGERVVELQSPAGKFWHTMGYADQGKQFLLPEEALYLMECGDLQVFFHDLPLSIQEGYKTLLSPESVTLQQYQVFGHLKRLGYAVSRFDPSALPTHYEMQINLPQKNDKHSRHLKRKLDHSVTPTPRHSEEQSLSKRMIEEKPETEAIPGLAGLRPAPSVSPEFSGGQGMDLDEPAERSRGTSWWMKEAVEECPGVSDSENTSTVPRWDFSSISFPDLGSSMARRSQPLVSPDPELLPGALKVGECDISPWLRRLNLHKEKLMWKERERLRNQQRYKRDINADPEVRKCKKWNEYLELLEKRRRHRSSSRRSKPAHLWAQEVKPLTHPGDSSSHGDLLKKISVIPSSRLLDEASRLSGDLKWRISFNIYQPDMVSEYKKSNPGTPYTRICVCSFDGPVPDLQAIKQLTYQSGNSPVTFAVVDHGDISFYSFKDFQLPVDVNQ
ncbi:tRNA-splicing endonuclease subunit Sen54 isoform X1 [Denticeps clupeoides]|uniref:tRNA-splicing endonuclease subunit Sen54 N-terminal domain-containing protein n=2 Tax=Denticeps clupeoides TaxID=299321 RepID=A0AAY4AQI4_9TELE|nr:tRNA-splicing endonuclease subunit Sen54 isoform X1 [Denticeps clupeoides]